MVRMACGVSGTTREIRGALAPFANSSSAKARRTTRTCCTPPLSNLASSFWSFGVTSILRGGRPIRQVCAKTILHKNGFLQYLQTVTDLVGLPLPVGEIDNLVFHWAKASRNRARRHCSGFTLGSAAARNGRNYGRNCRLPGPGGDS